MITLTFIFFLGLIGWTTSAFISKGKHQSEIKEEVKSMLSNILAFFNSLKNLLHLLIKDSIKSAASEDLSIVRDNVIEMVKGSAGKNNQEKEESDKRAA